MRISLIFVFLLSFCGYANAYQYYIWMGGPDGSDTPLTTTTLDCAETVLAGGTFTCEFEGGGPPFNWEIEDPVEGDYGTPGASWDEPTTWGRVNSIDLGPAACGTLRVYVSDYYGQSLSLTFQVSDAGQWVELGRWNPDIASMPGSSIPTPAPEGALYYEGEAAASFVKNIVWENDPIGIGEKYRYLQRSDYADASFGPTKEEVWRGYRVREILKYDGCPLTLGNVCARACAEYCWDARIAAGSYREWENRDRTGGLGTGFQGLVMSTYEEGAFGFQDSGGVVECFDRDDNDPAGRGSCSYFGSSKVDFFYPTLQLGVDIWACP